MMVIFNKTDMHVLEIFGEYLVVEDSETGSIYTIAYWQIETEYEESDIIEEHSNIISLEDYKKCLKRIKTNKPKKKLLPI